MGSVAHVEKLRLGCLWIYFSAGSLAVAVETVEVLGPRVFYSVMEERPLSSSVKRASGYLLSWKRAKGQPYAPGGDGAVTLFWCGIVR